MKLLTKQQLIKLKCDTYEDGFQHGEAMKKEVDKLWFIGVCTTIRENLDELEKNTWDKDRVRKLKEYLDVREKTFGEFISRVGE